MVKLHLRRALLGLLALVAWAWVGTARATSLVALSVEQITDASDYIVRGVVTAVRPEVDAHGRVWTRVDLEVQRVLKGPQDLQTLTLDVKGGVLPSKATLVDGVPRFDELEEVLVFAEVLESGLVVPTGFSQGKYTIRIDPDTGREMLVRFNPRLDQPYDHRFIPDPPRAQRVFLSDMDARVLDRVSRGWDGHPIPGKSPERLRLMYPGVVEVRP